MFMKFCRSQIFVENVQLCCCHLKAIHEAINRKLGSIQIKGQNKQTAIECSLQSRDCHPLLQITIIPISIKRISVTIHCALLHSHVIVIVWTQNKKKSNEELQKIGSAFSSLSIVEIKSRTQFMLCQYSSTKTYHQPKYV